jgi:hypothetical protein
MPKRPTFLDSPPPVTPTSPRSEEGTSRKTPIEIGSDSDSSSIVEVIDLPISRPKKVTRKTTPFVVTTVLADSGLKFRNVSEADRVDIKRLKRQMGIATRPYPADGMTEPKIFKYIPTERDRYLQADIKSQDQIIRRARTHLLFRVLRDLESL